MDRRCLNRFAIAGYKQGNHRVRREFAIVQRERAEPRGVVVEQVIEQILIHAG